MEKGYKVKALVTLDPVGEGMMVWLGSDIYLSKPTPKAEFWINVRADAKKPDSSDGVADFGERWIPQGPMSASSPISITTTRDACLAS